MLSLKKSRLRRPFRFLVVRTAGLRLRQKTKRVFRFLQHGRSGHSAFVLLFNGTVTQRKIKQKNLEIENNKIQHDLINEQMAIADRKCPKYKIHGIAKHQQRHEATRAFGKKCTIRTMLRNKKKAPHSLPMCWWLIIRFGRHNRATWPLWWITWKLIWR